MGIERALFVLVVYGICQSSKAAPEPIDINECAVNNGGCNPGATCVKTPGSFTCAYMNGLSTQAGYVCFDINECLTDNGGCSEKATCENTPGSFTCTCLIGYTGDGLNCTDINECSVNNGGCSQDATCCNTPGCFNCACKPGFRGDGFICTDIDECSSNNGGCNALATCYNTHGSFTCTCNVGYYGNGFSCYDYNECLSNNGGCNRHATCTNTMGSSYCTCKPGYTGNGLNCSASGRPSTSTSLPVTSRMTSASSQHPTTATILTTSSSETRSPPPSPSPTPAKEPRDCSDVMKLGNTTNGVYTVYVGDTDRAVTVYCDMTTTSGGWTVFQRRKDGSVNFYRDWSQYQQGFGDVEGEFWIGNDILNMLTSYKRYKLRVDLTQFSGATGYGEFDNFKVASSAAKYNLTSVGNYSGTIGDSLWYHVGQQFSTLDQDNDRYVPRHCAFEYHGAWWFKGCADSNLNGLYYNTTKNNNYNGVNWLSWTSYYNSMKTTEMKIKPFN